MQQPSPHKALVLFGSSSDQMVYNPIVEALRPIMKVEFQVLSAHRNPKELRVLLERDDFQLVVAGAGIAAHLPGVVASMTDKPVLGVPVASQLGGMDALFSIMQMPFGVPVLSFGPNRELEAGGLLDSLKQLLNAKVIGQKLSVDVVVDATVQNYEYAAKEIARLQAFIDDPKVQSALTVELNIKNTFDGINPRLVLVHDPKMIHLADVQNVFSMFVPLLDDATKNNPSKAFQLYEWVARGGAWFGINNSRNALLWLQKSYRHLYSRD